MHVAWRKQLDAVQCMHLQYTPSILRSLSQILCLRLGTWAGVRINRHECVSVWKDGKCECCIRCTRCTSTHTHHQRSSAACQCLVLSYHLPCACTPFIFEREKKRCIVCRSHSLNVYIHFMCESHLSSTEYKSNTTNKYTVFYQC